MTATTPTLDTTTEQPNLAVRLAFAVRWVASGIGAGLRDLANELRDIADAGQMGPDEDTVMSRSTGGRV